MTKAKLIKRQEVAEKQQERQMRKVQKPVVQKTVNAVTEWIETRNRRIDPRTAFAALFAQPQTQ